MITFVGRAAAVFKQHTLETAVVGLAHGGVNANVGGDPGQHDVIDPAQAQHELEIGCAERAFARLVDDRFALMRCKVGDDLPTGLAAHQNAAARPRIADAGADLA